MGALAYLTDYPQPSKRMKIPLQTEIAKYMEEKKGWPKEFCLYYADKFWNNYNAAGWKLSNGNMMKDWRSAFCAQWQNLKYPEDIQKLKECEKDTLKNVPNMTDEQAAEFFNKILLLYKNGWKPPREDAYKIYEELHRIGWMRLPRAKIEEILIYTGNDSTKYKLYFLKELFDRMIKENKQFGTQRSHEQPR